MRTIVASRLAHYPKRDKIPAYRLAYPSDKKVKPVHIKPIFSQKQIQQLAMNSVLYNSHIGVMMVYMLSQMDENEY